MKIHHIGYAVKNLEATLDLFLKLGYELVSGQIRDEKRLVEIAFVQLNGTMVELISPMRDDSPISNYLSKIGNTPYHFCYEVENIEETIKSLRALRFLVVEKPSEAIAIDNQKVAFLYNPKYGLLELLEING